MTKKKSKMATETQKETQNLKETETHNHYKEMQSNNKEAQNDLK